MVVGDVRADQQNDVGVFQVFVRSGRAIAAEGHLVTGDGARHAQRRVAVVVVGAEPELHQLAERVELFGDQLAGAEHAERFRRRTSPASRGIAPTITSSASSQPTRTSLPFLRSSGYLARFSASMSVVFRKALGAKLAAIHRMRSQRPRRDRASVLHADLHAAAHRAIAARGGDPIDPEFSAPTCSPWSRLARRHTARCRMSRPAARFQFEASRHAALRDGEMPRRCSSERRRRKTASARATRRPARASERDRRQRAWHASGSTIPAAISSAESQQKKLRRQAGEQRPEARSSNASECDSQRNFSACVSSCADAPAAARASNKARSPMRHRASTQTADQATAPSRKTPRACNGCTMPAAPAPYKCAPNKYSASRNSDVSQRRRHRLPRQPQHTNRRVGRRRPAKSESVSTSRLSQERRQPFQRAPRINRAARDAGSPGPGSSRRSPAIPTPQPQPRRDPQSRATACRMRPPKAASAPA